MPARPVSSPSGPLPPDKDQLPEIAKANAAAMCAKAGVPIPESLRPKAILQLPLPTPSPTPLSLPLPLPMPMGMGMGMGNMGQMGMGGMGPMGMGSMSNMTMSAAMASMTAATMTAALSNMGALASMPPLAPLPTITNKPPPCLAPPAPPLNLGHIEEVKRKVTQQANIHTIKELTEVSPVCPPGPRVQRTPPAQRSAKTNAPVISEGLAQTGAAPPSFTPLFYSRASACVKSTFLKLLCTSRVP